MRITDARTVGSPGKKLDRAHPRRAYLYSEILISPDNLQQTTNAQCSIPNSHRMGIEHWELSIGQIVCFLIRDRICEKLYLVTSRRIENTSSRRLERK